MANHRAAEKSIRKTVREDRINSVRRSRIRTFVRKVEEAIQSGNGDSSRKALVEAQKELSRAVTKGLIKANSASRKISRLNARVKNIVINTGKSKSKTA